MITVDPAVDCGILADSTFGDLSLAARIAIANDFESWYLIFADS
jgi:hypothetical protein